MDETAMWKAAEAAYEANRHFRKALGDHELLPWPETTREHRDTILAGVASLLHDPTAGPKDSHERWVEYMKDRGWSYGPTKDPAQKKHPCMVGWASLPDWQKAKDMLFVSIVRGVAAYYGSGQQGG